MSGSIRYQGGVPLQSFGVVRPSEANVRAGFQTIEAAGRVLNATANAIQEQAEIEGAREGSKVGLKRDEEGNLQPLTLLSDVTAYGRAFNKTAIQAYGVSALADADTFLKATRQRVETERVKNPDGTLGELKSKDPVSDFTTAAEAYRQRMLANMPDETRALVAPVWARAFGEHVRGIGERQSLVAMQRDMASLNQAMNLRQQDALRLAETNPEAARQATMEALQIWELIGTRFETVIDKDKWPANRQQVADAIFSGDGYREALELYRSETAKGPQREERAMQAVERFLTSQNISDEQRTYARTRLNIESTAARQALAEQQQDEYRRFFEGLPALYSAFQQTAAEKGPAAAMDQVQQAAARYNNPQIRNTLYNMGMQYASNSAVIPPEQMMGIARTLDSYRRGRSADMIPQDIAAGSFGPPGPEQNRNAQTAMNLAVEFQRSTATARTAYVSTVDSLLRRANADGFIENAQANRSDIVAEQDALFKGYEPIAGMGRRLDHPTLGDVRLSANPQGFAEVVRRTGVVGKEAASQILQGLTSTEGLSLEQLQQRLGAVGMILNSPNVDRSELSKDEAQYGAIMRLYSRMTGALSKLNPDEFAHLKPEDREAAMNQRRNQVAADLQAARQEFRAIAATSPADRERAFNTNLPRFLESVGRPADIDAQYLTPGYIPATINAAADIAADTLIGMNLGGATTIFRGNQPITTIRMATFAGNEIDHFAMTGTILNFPTLAAGSLGMMWQGLTGGSVGADEFQRVVASMFAGDNVNAGPAFKAHYQAKLKAALSTPDVVIKDVQQGILRSMRDEGWGATQFHPDATQGNKSVEQWPLERSLGGTAPAIHVLTRFMQQYGFNGPEARVGDAWQLVARNDVFARYTGNVMVDGKEHRRYTVSYRPADVRESLRIVGEPLLVPVGADREIDRVSRAAQEAEANRIRQEIQSGRNPHSGSSMTPAQQDAAAARGERVGTIMQNRALPEMQRIEANQRGQIDADMAAVWAAGFKARMEYLTGVGLIGTTTFGRTNPMNLGGGRQE